MQTVMLSQMIIIITDKVQNQRGGQYSAEVHAETLNGRYYGNQTVRY